MLVFPFLSGENQPILWTGEDSDVPGTSRVVSAEAEAAAPELKNLMHKALLQNRGNSGKGRNPATHHRGLVVPNLQLSPPVTSQQAEHADQLLACWGLICMHLTAAAGSTSG